MTEGLLGRLVELRDDPLVVDRDDRVQRRFEDGAFRAWASASAA